MKLDAAQLRESNPTPEQIRSIRRNPVYIVVDNVLDTYNVGAIFRLADAGAVAGVYLVGQTNVPTDEKVGHKIQKASVGTWKWTPWKHTNTVKEAIGDIKNVVTGPWPAEHQVATTNVQVVAVEQSDNSIPYTEFNYTFPLVLILGHETDGVSKEGFEVSDAAVEIPMFGVNKSLNVMVSLAIVMWHVIGKFDIVKP